MKSTILFVVAVFLSGTAFAQSEKTQKITSQYIYPDFSKGTIKQKNGVKQQIVMNYNSLTQEMIFEQDGKRLALVGATVDTVYLKDKKFVPAAKGFYELATNTPIPLYVQHVCRVVMRGRTGTYGLDNQTSGNVSATRIGDADGSLYGLDLPDDYQIVSESKFYLKNGSDISQLTNSKQVIKAFPAKEAAIKEFIKANNISFTKQEDLEKLIVFCNKA